MEDPHESELTALTPIWTGDANRQGDRLITTGLLGSIRWWFEVLVRGLGGSACDPTQDGNRCPDADKKPHMPGHHCVACELFGCTGWARKFRFEVLDNNGNGKVKTSQIKKGEIFKLRFTPLRSVRPEEWALLNLTLRLIAKYGALGGKTKLRKRNDGIGIRPGHGLGQVRVEKSPSDLASPTWQEISNHLHESRWRRPNHEGFEWAAADKLEALPRHRDPEALLQHLRSDSSGGK
jgi:CRISPR-associated protein Cmr1